jgi:hypothetical protein
MNKLWLVYMRSDNIYRLFWSGRRGNKGACLYALGIILHKMIFRAPQNWAMCVTISVCCFVHSRCIATIFKVRSLTGQTKRDEFVLFKFIVHSILAKQLLDFIPETEVVKYIITVDSVTTWLGFLFTIIYLGAKFVVTLLFDEIQPRAEGRIQCPLSYNETQVLGVLWLLIR